MTGYGGAVDARHALAIGNVVPRQFEVENIDVFWSPYDPETILAIVVSR